MHRATWMISLMQGCTAVFGAALALLALSWLLPSLRGAAGSLGSLLTTVPSTGPGLRPGSVLLASFLVIVSLVLWEMWQARLQA